MALNYYDKASRFAASKLDPEAFLCWLLNLPADTFTFRGWLNTRNLPLPADPDRISDTVAHLEDASQHGVPWVLVIEFQSQPDPEMFGRLLGYFSAFWLQSKPDEERGSRFQLGAAVVNLTGSGSTSRDMDWPAAGLHTQLKLVERNLEHESADELVTGIESGQWSRCLLPWVPLMSGGGKPDIIEKWKTLAEAESNRRHKAEFAVLALIFAEKAGHKEIWQQKLEGWNVEESTVVNEWIAVGEKRGIALGEARHAQQTILRLGEKTLGPAPEGIAEVIQSIQDRARLERIIDRVLDAPTWGDLAATP